MVDADITVFLTTAQYTRKSKGPDGRAEFTGQSHFRMTNEWVGVPLFGPRRAPLDQVKVSREPQALGKLEMAVRPMDEHAQWFMGHVRRAGTLAQLGVAHLQDLNDQLGLGLVMATDREIGVTADQHEGTDWMLAIAKAVGATVYSAGGSAVIHYLDPLKFEDAGVRVEIQRWDEQTAPTVAVPGLSVFEWMRWAPLDLAERLA
jgi:hypothetical protein